MAYCSKCGYKLSEDALFCARCGAPASKEEKERSQAPVGRGLEDADLDDRAEHESAEVFEGYELDGTRLPEETRGKRKEAFDGMVHKCPQCGQTLDAFSPACPSCGYELRDSRGITSLRELSLGIQEIILQYSTGSKKRQSQRETGDLVAALIRSFPIPNTREDLIEFIIASAANVNPEAFDDTKRKDLSPIAVAMSNAWLSKLEQAYQKASITIANDPSFPRIKALYDKTMRKVFFASHDTLRTILLIGLSLLPMVLLLVLSEFM